MIGKNTPQNRLSCQSLMEWHDWLKDHHDKEPEDLAAALQADPVATSRYNQKMKR